MDNLPDHEDYPSLVIQCGCGYYWRSYTEPIERCCSACACEQLGLIPQHEFNVIAVGGENTLYGEIDSNWDTLPDACSRRDELFVANPRKYWHIVVRPWCHYPPQRETWRVLTPGEIATLVGPLYMSWRNPPTV